MVSARKVVTAVQQQGCLLKAYAEFLCQAPIEGEDDSHSDGKIHPSSISGCMTRAIYTSLGFPSFAPIDVKAIRIFGMGHAIHRMLQADLHKARLLDLDDKKKPQVEVLIDVPKYNLTGHMDGITDKKVYGGRKVLEIKSINSNSFATLKEPKEEHKLQAGCYVFACQHMEGLQDIDGVVFIYYSKNDSEVAEFPYQVSDGLLKTVKDRLVLMGQKMEEAKRFISLPDPCYEDPAVAPCKWCQWKSVCHATFERQAYADKVLPKMPAILAKILAKKEKPNAAESQVEKPASSEGRRLLPPRRLPCVRS